MSTFGDDLGPPVVGRGGFTDATVMVTALRRLWLDAARLGSIDGDEPHADEVASWFASLPAPSGQDGADTLLDRFELTYTVDDGWSRLSAFGAAAAMIEPTAEWFADLGADADEMNRLAELGPALDPDLFGSWIESRGDVVDAGWSTGGEFDDATALDVVDDPAVRDAVSEFLTARADTSVASVGRSVGATPTARITIDAGSVDDDDAVAAAINLFAHIGVEAPSSDLVGAVLAFGGAEPLRVVVHALDDGIARVGLAVGSPSTELLAEVARVGGFDLDRVAATQGTLMSAEPSWLGVWTTADGTKVDVSTSLPAN